MSAPEKPSNEERRGSQARSLWALLLGFMTRGGEMAVAVLVVLGCFVLFLMILTSSFPAGTGLSDLVSSSASTIGQEGPAEVLSEAVHAFVSHVRRSAKTRHATTIAWNTAQSGDRLTEGDALQTYSNSNAVVRVGRKSELDIGENSLVVLREDQGGESPDDLYQQETSVTLMSGELHSQISPTEAVGFSIKAGQDGPSIRTRGGTTSAMKVSIDSKQRSVVVAHQGSIEIETAQGPVVLGPRQYIKIAADGEVSPIGLAPESPRLGTPADGEVFVGKKKKAEAHFVWTPPEAGVTSRFEIARDLKFRDIVSLGRVKENEFTHANLKPGLYYWRVSALRGDVEGAPARTRRFTVARDAAPPRLDVEAPNGPVATERVTIEGRTEPGCSVFVNGEKVETKTQGGFQLHLTLQPGTNLFVVEAVDDVGNVAYHSLYVTAKF